MIRTNCFHKIVQKHRLPETYINKDYANVIKFMKITEQKFDTEQAENTKSAEQ